MILVMRTSGTAVQKGFYIMHEMGRWGPVILSWFVDTWGTRAIEFWSLAGSVSRLFRIIHSFFSSQQANSVLDPLQSWKSF